MDDPPEVPEVFCVCDEVGQEAEPDDGEEAVAGFCEAIFCMVAASSAVQPMVCCAPADVQMLLAIFGFPFALIRDNIPLVAEHGVVLNFAAASGKMPQSPLL